MATALTPPPPIREVDFHNGQPLDEAWLHADEPWVARGLVANWPLVQSSTSDDEALSYIASFSAHKKTSAFLAEAEHDGRLFYNDTFDGFNFIQMDTTLEAVFSKLLALKAEAQAPTLYVGSTNIDQALPGFRAANNIAIPNAQPLASLWVGNQSRIAAHFDYPRNWLAVSWVNADLPCFPLIKWKIFMWVPGILPPRGSRSVWSICTNQTSIAFHAFPKLGPKHRWPS